MADNKVSLFAFLAGQLAQLHVEGKLIISTIDNTAITSLQISHSADMITPCNHEEEDSRLLLHAAHCLATGHERIMVTILFLANRFWTTRARMPLDVGRELTSIFLTLYTFLHHVSISLLPHNDIIA